jgi:glycosyltransferase involved in cell wall biosynthesis
VKIEMILPSLAAAGMEVMVARLVRKLVARGHDVGVTCIVDKGLLAPELEAIGIRVSLPGAHGLVNPTWLMRLTAHLKSVSPEVVHIHSGAWFKGVMAARASGISRVIYTAHGFIAHEPRIETVLNRIAAPLTRRVVSVSDQLADVLKARGLAGRELAVIANGIDLDLFCPGIGPGEIRKRLGIAAETLVVGTVARLEPIKNQAMLVDGIALARGKGVNCAVVLIGEGSLRSDLAAQAERLGISEHVHFWGLERNVARLYPELDVFALTSDAEGTSISLLEAMASGVCPVATYVGGNPAVIGDAGVLVGTRRPDEFAEALRVLGEDPARRAALAKAARARVVAQFSDEVMLDAYEALYRR